MSNPCDPPPPAWWTRFWSPTPEGWRTFQIMCLFIVAVVSPVLALSGCPPWVGVLVSCFGAGAAFAAQFTTEPQPSVPPWRKPPTILLAVVSLLALAATAQAQPAAKTCLFGRSSQQQHADPAVVAALQAQVAALNRIADQQAQLIALLAARQQGPPAPGPQFYMLPNPQGQAPPQQQIPIVGAPQQQLPIQGAPQQQLMPQGQPQQQIQIFGAPQTPIAPQGAPQQQLGPQPQTPQQQLPIAPATPRTAGEQPPAAAPQRYTRAPLVPRS